MELVKSWGLRHFGLVDIAIQQNVCALVNLQEFFSWTSTRTNDLGPQKNSCEKMEGFSQNAYEYILEKCVGLGNLFLASTKRSYVAFHPFAFQGETQKKIRKCWCVDDSKRKKCVIKEAKLKKQRKMTRFKNKKNLGLCLPLGTGPWTWDQVLHTMTHQVWIIILIIIPLGLDFHGTLPFFGTYEIGLWDIVWSAPK